MQGGSQQAWQQGRRDFVAQVSEKAGRTDTRHALAEPAGISGTRVRFGIRRNGRRLLRLTQPGPGAGQHYQCHPVWRSAVTRPGKMATTSICRVYRPR